VRGPSPWKRGVRDGTLVLVCPECQRTHDWTADMDHCPSCGSAALSRVLGETTCKACGAAVGGGGNEEPPAGALHQSAPGLSTEVAEALERTFRRREA
jgi:ribosomal protein L37AE/L43A